MSVNISEIIKRKDEHAQRFSSILKEVALNIGEISAKLKKNNLTVAKNPVSFFPKEQKSANLGRSI